MKNFNWPALTLAYMLHMIYVNYSVVSHVQESGIVLVPVGITKHKIYFRKICFLEVKVPSGKLT